MTTAPTASLASQPSHPPLITREGWLWIAALGGLFVALHWNHLYRTWRIALSDNDWSHALIVPLIAIYYIYQNRQRLAQQQRRVSWWGLPIMFIGLFSYAFWIFPGRNDMFQGYSMILTLFGLVLFVLGRDMMRVLWFPILYLVFAVKVAERIWALIAVKLQFIAAEGATVALKFFTVFVPGFIDVENRGSTIDLTFHKIVNGVPVAATESLNVAEACAGLRMLMAFLALGVALAFLFPRPWWQRLAMCLMAVPIAVAVNIGRVTTLGLLYLYNPDMASGDFHTFVGMLMLIPAAGLFLLLGWVLDKIVVTDPHRHAHDPAAANGQAAYPPPERQEKSVLSLGRGALLTAAGAAIVVIAGAIYWLTLANPIPPLRLPLVPAVLEVMGARLSWTLLPAALVSTALALVLLRKLIPPGARAAATRSTAAMCLVAGVLLASTVVQGTVIAATQTVLHKQAVPVREHLYMIPAQAGPWKLIHQDPPLSKEMEGELGTTEYISWVYEDTSWPKGTPGRQVRIHVAYYTGTADTVPHVPERCFTAAGAQWLGKYSAVLDVNGPDYVTERQPDGSTQIYAASAVARGESRIPTTDVPATVFAFSDSQGRQASNVVYFFAANGGFFANPDEVRANGFDPTDRFAYYCKIEIQCFDVTDSKLAEQRAASLLSGLLPEIMACLPDWVDVAEGRWPLDTVSEPS